jgi:hypothetical protein
MGRGSLSKRRWRNDRKRSKLAREKRRHEQRLATAPTVARTRHEARQTPEAPSSSAPSVASRTAASARRSNEFDSTTRVASLSQLQSARYPVWGIKTPFRPRSAHRPGAAGSTGSFRITAPIAERLGDRLCARYEHPWPELRNVEFARGPSFCTHATTTSPSSKTASSGGRRVEASVRADTARDQCACRRRRRRSRTGIPCGVRKLRSCSEAVFMDESAETVATLDARCGCVNHAELVAFGSGGARLSERWVDEDPPGSSAPSSPTS